MSRTIIHADLDAFYASVEQLDDPNLQGKPVIVGGAPEGRAVVLTASYEARRFGVHSAMPMSRALRLCPEAVRVPPRFDRYIDLSKQVMAVFRSVTPLVEPLSLDEAFLDVTGDVVAYGDVENLARVVKQQVRDATGLTVSVGIGANKTVAKIASDKGKPDGLVFIPSGSEASFLAPLPVRALWGVGPKTEDVLRGAGLKTIGELAQADSLLLSKLLPSWWQQLQNMARGNDERAIQTDRTRKSIGAETTFARDLPDDIELRRQMSRLADQVAAHLQKANLRARTVTVKLRYANFHTITRQRSLPLNTDDSVEIKTTASGLLDAVTTPTDRFRLIGIHLSGLTGQPNEQLTLFSD